MKIQFTLAPILAVLAIACGRGGDRQEDIDKLRAIGVATVPVVATLPAAGTAAGTVELTVYALFPKGEATPTVSAFRDPAQHTGIVLEEAALTLIAGSAKVTEESAFNLLEAKVTAQLPAARGSEDTAQQVHYGVRISSGTDEELVSGEFMAYPAGAAELAWTAVSVDLVQPTDGGQVAKKTNVDIEGSVGNPNNEDVKLGWFVSGGEISNRRSSKTTWKTPEAGPQTLILTARGKSSKSFGMKVLNVTSH